MTPCRASEAINDVLIRALSRPTCTAAEGARRGAAVATDTSRIIDLIGRALSFPLNLPYLLDQHKVELVTKLPLQSSCPLMERLSPRPLSCVSSPHQPE